MTKRTSIETAAQNLIFAPEHTSAHTDTLDATLTGHYTITGMRDRLPGKTNFLIERGVRSAAWAAMWHVITTQVIRDTLPQLRRGKDIIPENVSMDRGPYHAFIDAGAALLANASEAVLDSSSSNEWRRYRPVWEKIVERQEGYRTRWHEWNQELTESRAVTPPNPPVEPRGKDAIKDIWDGSAEEIAKSALWALSNKQESDPASDTRNARDLTRRALASAAVMNWATTMKRTVNLELFPNLFEDLPDDLDANFLMPTSGHAFVDDGNDTPCAWAHASFAKGPWREPGSCAGRIWLQPDLHTDQDNTEELFVIGETYAGAPIPRIGEGNYNGGLVMLTLGSFIAERTIYANQQ